jgi:uncharacterized membrane protein
VSGRDIAEGLGLIILVFPIIAIFAMVSYLVVKRIYQWIKGEGGQ